MRKSIVLVVLLALLAIPAVSSSSLAATPRCQGLLATHVGTSGPNVIRGTNRRDVIVAKGGADKIFGRGGDDTICAGAGADIVSGGPGGDRIFGGSSHDLLKGNGAFDLLNGGPGSDKCLKGGGGGKLVLCETADLAVSVDSPEIGPPGVASIFDITVTNNGPNAVAYFLDLTDDNTGASCSGLDSGTYAQPPLASGADRLWQVGQTCDIEGDPSQVWMTAVVRARAIDPNAANNADQSTTDIKEP